MLTWRADRSTGKKQPRDHVPPDARSAGLELATRLSTVGLELLLLRREAGRDFFTVRMDGGVVGVLAGAIPHDLKPA